MSDDRNPLNEKALTAGELTVGREIVLFNIYHGKRKYRVAGRPSNGWVALKLIGAKKPSDHSLADLGIERYDGSSWNKTNFCVDASDVASLPKLVAEPPPSSSGRALGLDERYDF